MGGRRELGGKESGVEERRGRGVVERRGVWWRGEGCGGEGRGVVERGGVWWRGEGCGGEERGVVERGVVERGGVWWRGEGCGGEGRGVMERVRGEGSRAKRREEMEEFCLEHNMFAVFGRGRQEAG